MLSFKPQFCKVANTSSLVFLGFLSLFTILLNALQANLGLMSIKFDINSIEQDE